MRLFITGGAGFIGSNFIHYFLNKNDKNQVLNYDKLTYAGRLSNLNGIDEARYQFIKGDITDIKLLRSSVESFKPDGIIHYAAESHVDRSLESASEFLITNVIGTQTVLEVSRDLSIRMVHVSTDEVYGSKEDGESSEGDPFEPNSPYSASKAGGDLLCRASYRSFGTQVVVVRGSNCFGPRQHEEKLIPKTITNLLNNKKIPLYSDGSNIREWIFTEDFCSGVETALLHGKIGESYNLGGGSDNRVSNLSIAKTLASIIHPESDPTDHLEFVKDRLGHDRRYALCSEKLLKLGWKRSENLIENLKKTVVWYQNNWKQ